MKELKKYSNLIIGLLIQALAFNLFLAPNNLAATDVSGLGIIIQNVYHINPAIFVFIINILLLFVSYYFLGKEKTIKTIVGSFLLPVFILITSNFSKYVDLSGIDLMILAIFGGILTGIGTGLIFKSGYTSGGTDIIEDLLCKAFKMSLAQSVFLVDGVIVLLGGFVFGFEIMMYSIIALATISVFSNRKALGIDEDKIVLITTKNKKKVVDFIKNNYHYGITIMDAEGGYTNTKNDVIMCSINSNNYYRINEEIKRLVPDAFIVVINSYETKYINKESRKKALKK